MERKVAAVERLTEEEIDVEVLDDAVQKEMKNLSFKHFTKITIKKGGRKPKPVERGNLEQEATASLHARLLHLQVELSRIAEEGAHVGQIYKLREIVMGNKKKIKQTPASIKDPDTGREVFDAEGIKDCLLYTSPSPRDS